MKYLKLFILQVFWYLAIKFGSSTIFPLFASTLFICDYFIFNRSRVDLPYLIFSFALILFGCLMDQTFQYFKMITWGNQLYPLELFSVWIVFPCYYQEFFSRFSQKLLIAFILGFVFGPVAYYSGAKINETISLSNNIFHLIIIGIFWAVLFSASISIYSTFVNPYKCKK